MLNIRSPQSGALSRSNGSYSQPAKPLHPLAWRLVGCGCQWSVLPFHTALQENPQENMIRSVLLSRMTMFTSGYCMSLSYPLHSPSSVKFSFAWSPSAGAKMQRFAGNYIIGLAQLALAWVQPNDYLKSSDVPEQRK